MSFPVISVMLLASLAAPGWETGTLATFDGEMMADAAEDNVGAKTLTLNVFVAAVDQESTTLLWTLQDKGRGGFSWVGQYGAWRLSRDGRTLRGKGPTLLFDHGQGAGEAAITLLFAQPNLELQEGAVWTQGRYEYSVAESGVVRDREAWRVAVRGPTGSKGEVWYEQPTGTVLAATEHVTLGQGKPFTMKLKEKASQQLSPEQQAAAVAAFERWEELRDALKLEPEARQIDWTETQLKILKENLPEAVQTAANTLLASIAVAAEEDLREQSGRFGRVSALRAKALDRLAPNFELQGIRGETVSNQDLTGAVTVLHFWEYRDAPLEEPYGQVGYLDFLYRKHKDAGLKVFGVNVDERLANGATRGAVVTSARKLQSFMNLSYPVLLDDGTMLKRFGDPRTAGGALPLFVMIGADGKVQHYHAGFHVVDRDLGLKELDQAARTSLRK